MVPCKSKKPNLDVLKYIKERKYPEAEIGKYLYAVREGESREGRQYVGIQLSVAHDFSWGDWYTTLQGRWMKKVEKHLKLCNLECVDPLWFGWLGRITWQMMPTDDLCEVNKRRSRIYLGMNSKLFADGRRWSENKKHTNAILFECKRRNVA